MIIRWKALDNLSPSDIKLKDLPRKPDGLYNMHLNEYGQVVKRPGYSKYNITSLGAAHKIIGMQRFYLKDLSKEFLVAWNTKIYKLAETTPWGGTAILSESGTDLTLTADKDTFFVNFDDVCYFLNGTDGVFKYDKTYARTDGITVPTAASKNSLIDGALGTGNYKIKITYVDEDGYESNGGTSVTIAAEAHPNDGIKLNIPTSSDDKIAKRRIYRTALNGVIYYYDGEVADNTTTTYDSIIADSSLGTILKTTHTAPQGTSHLIAKRRNKIYIAYQDYVYPSHTSDVEYFPAAWRQRTGNSQKITGLLELLTTLPVFTNDSIERLIGTDEDDIHFKNSYSTEGCVAIRSLVNCDNLHVYLGFNGINWFDGVSSGIFSKALNKYITENIVDAYRHLSCAAYFKDKYILCYPKTGGTYPTETVWIDLKNKTYGVYSFAFSCFSLWDKGTDGMKLKGGSNTIGRVYSVFDGLDDDGSNIIAYDDIEPLDMGKPEVYKQWFSVLMKIKTTTGTAFRLYYTLDDESETYASKTLTANTTKWYRIGLGAGGRNARSFKPRPYMSDKYAWEYHGIEIIYEDDPFAEGRD